MNVNLRETHQALKRLLVAMRDTGRKFSELAKTLEEDDDEV